MVWATSKEEKKEHVSSLLQGDQRFGYYIDENLFVVKEMCRIEKLQSSINVNPQLPFRLENDKSGEQPFRPQCVEDEIPSLDEVHFCNGWQEVTPREDKHEDG